MIKIFGTVYIDVNGFADRASSPNEFDGKAHLEFGGPAYNIAANLTAFCQPPLLCVALKKDSTFTNMIETNLRERRIKYHIMKDDRLTDNLKVTIYKGHSAMASVVDASVDQFLFTQEAAENIIEKGDVVIITTDLSVQSLSNITAAANAKGAKTIITGESVITAKRIGQMTASPTYVILNENEMDELCISRFGFKSYTHAAKASNADFVVTLGNKGSVIIYANGETFFSPVEPVETEGASLGAGEVFVSCVANDIMYGETLEYALRDIGPIVGEQIKSNNSNMLDAGSFESSISSAFKNAAMDELTGVFNRRGFDDELLRSFRPDSQNYIVMFDIDHFKSINDTFGHQVGDIVLQKVCGAIKGSIRASDILARYGGEEFVLYMSSKPGDEENVKAAVERILKKIRNLSISEIDRKVTTSAGISLFKNYYEFEAALKRADSLLYKSKNEGRDRLSCEWTEKQQIVAKSA